MRTWPIHPVIYEINTWVWLGELSRKASRSVNLATVPETEWDAIASHGFDALWLMGVWERSPAGIENSMPTGWSTEMPGKCGCISWQTIRTSTDLSVFWKTTTNPGPRHFFPRKRPGPWPLRSSPFPGRSCSTRGRLRAGRCAFRPSSAAGRMSHLSPTLRRSTGRFLERPTMIIFRKGQWGLCERTGWPDNASYVNILAWCWEMGPERHLIVLNFSGTPAQALVRLPWIDMRNRTWQFSDPLSGEVFERSGGDMADNGLFLSLDPWRHHFFRLESSG